ncbi:MAG: Fic family protein [Dehalococcoidia bacterium]
MFTPIYSAENERLMLSLDEVDRIMFRVERMLIMPKHEQWLRREASVRTAYSSTMIEDGTIPEHEMEDAVKASPVADIPKERAGVANYARALEFVDFLSDADMPLNEAIIRQIHWLLMSGVHDTQIKPGQYRTGPNWIEDQGVIVYESPFHVSVPILMREFSEWLTGDEAMSPVLKAGIAHAHLVAIHPFVDGNGRTARLLATLLLQSRGYGFRKLLSLDAYYQRNRDSFIGALRQTLGASYTEGYDLTPWLELFVESLIVQARMLERRLTDWRMTVDKLHKVFAPYGLMERQVDGLLHAARNGFVTRKDYVQIAAVSPLTATRDLAQLTHLSLLRPEGSGRNRRYIWAAGDTMSNTEETQRTLHSPQP